ncbi:MAG: cyclodeaminase/cyclohydrolase family protein [Gemmatimonadetes bacterium]|nr:cyclodeaminase/cyclohydrolase family protein [Gemmatimonadota bacterium]
MTGQPSPNSSSYHMSIDNALRDISSVDAAPASGAATALVLSLAIECLALQLALTLGSDSPQDHGLYYTALGDRLTKLREDARQSHHDDAAAFAGVLLERSRRREAPTEDHLLHVTREMECLAEANSVLLRMAALAHAIAADAEIMFSGRGAPQARAESGVAMHLAAAALNSVTEMLTLNVHTAVRRANDFGVRMSGVAAIRVAAAETPSADAKRRLENELGEIDWDETVA